MRKSIVTIIFFFIVGMDGGIFADQILGPQFFYQQPITQNVTKIEEIHIQENTALKDGIEKGEKVVVGIKTKTSTGRILEGSGLIITSDGFVVTLAELVPKGSTFTVYIDGEEVDSQILKRDSEEKGEG